MSRLPDLQRDRLTANQQRVYDEIAETLPSRKVRGPWAIWLRAPNVAHEALRLHHALRAHDTLDQRLFELMVMVITRHWSAQFAWAKHSERGRARGVPADVVEAIRAGRRPNFAREDERLTYEIVTELLERRTLSQPSYERAAAALGVESLVELIAGAGFYTMVAMTLSAFDVPESGT